jgi:hypothetical protein
MVAASLCDIGSRHYVWACCSSRSRSCLAKPLRCGLKLDASWELGLNWMATSTSAVRTALCTHSHALDCRSAYLIACQIKSRRCNQVKVAQRSAADGCDGRWQNTAAYTPPIITARLPLHTTCSAQSLRQTSRPCRYPQNSSRCPLRTLHSHPDFQTPTRRAVDSPRLVYCDEQHSLV